MTPKNSQRETNADHDKRVRIHPGRKPEGTGPLGFEPRFEAPEASVMSKLYYGPTSDGAGAPAGPYCLFGRPARGPRPLRRRQARQIGPVPPGPAFTGPLRRVGAPWAQAGTDEAAGGRRPERHARPLRRAAESL